LVAEGARGRVFFGMFVTRRGAFLALRIKGSAMMRLARRRVSSSRRLLNKRRMGDESGVALLARQKVLRTGVFFLLRAVLVVVV
jgi:hypothetical protein